MEDNLSPFIVREIPWNPYEYCRRMIVKDGLLVIFIDGTGRFEVPVSEVHLVLAGLGPVRVKSLHDPAGKMSLSETGKGVWIKIQGSEYVTPAERVRKVISGEHWKAAVFVWRGVK
ncbi:MAG TPA: hypothetical protein VN372_13205, partial [Methanospirillum sp.]|nr:hypothetical protein [Methanospirillum sp.]